MLDPKKTASMIMGEKFGGDSGSESDSPDMHGELKAIASDLLEGFHTKNHELVTQALEGLVSHIQAQDMGEDEREHETEGPELS